MDRIYRYNQEISHKPNGGTYLQLITAKDLYIQNISVAEHDGHSDSFQVKFPNVFTHYPNDSVRAKDQRFKDWDNYKFNLWQSQLNFAVFCASSACGVSVEHLNAKEPMIRRVYRFHVYYQIRRILNRLEIPLPYENSFNKYNNPYNHEKCIKICKECGVSDENEGSDENKVSDEKKGSCNLTKWRNQKYFSTWQSRAWETGRPGMSCINVNYFSRWIIEKSDGITKPGIKKLSELVRDYAYLILTSQTSTRSQIIGFGASEFDAQRTFLNTFENIIVRRVNIPEDKLRFRKVLQYARSKVDFVIGERMYMIPSDMNLRIAKIKNYNNEILELKSYFKLGINKKINLDEEKGKPDVKPEDEGIVKTKPDVKQKKEPDVKSNEEHKQDVKPNIEIKHDMNKITYEEEKVALILGTMAVFTVWWMFK